MAARLNLTIEQGATFQAVITWEIDGDPVDLTGYEARMQARQTVKSDSKVLDLDTDSGITLGGVLGTITIDLTAEQTADINIGKLVYDLELVTGDYVKRLVQGNITIKPEVTR